MSAAGRAENPYPPRNVLFDGVAFPASFANTSPITVTWARSLRTKSTLSFQTDADETPDVSTNYFVRHGPAHSFRTDVDLGTGTTGTFNFEFAGTNLVEVYAKDNITSRISNILSFLATSLTGASVVASGDIGTIGLTAPTDHVTISIGGPIGTIGVFASLAPHVSGALDTLTLTGVTGEATIEVGGLIPQVSIVPLLGTVHVDANASGLIPSITTTPPTGLEEIPGSASGDIGTLTFTAPEGVEGVEAAASGSIGTITISEVDGAATGGGGGSPTRREIIQVQANTANGTDGTTTQVHFATAPTNGNLLVAVAMLYAPNGAPNASSGWAIHSQSSGSTGMYVAVFYKYAGASESTTQQPEASGRDYWGLTMWEISGVSGTIGTDLIAAHISEGAQTYPSSGPYTTSSFNTGSDDELILGGFVGNSGAGNLIITSGSYVNEAIYSENSGNLCAATAVYTTVDTSGTAVVSTISSNVGSNGSYAWLELTSGPPAPPSFTVVQQGATAFNYKSIPILTIAWSTYSGRGVAEDDTILNPGGSAFNGTVPSGYEAWDSSGATDWTNFGPGVYTPATHEIHGTNSNGWASALAVSPGGYRSSGKLYFEYHILTLAGQAGATFDTQFFGVANNGINLGSYLGSTPNQSVGAQSQGSIYGATGGWQGAQQGDYVYVAVDIDNLLIWFATSANTDWNNSGTADPTTGVGGISLAGINQSDGEGPYVRWNQKPTVGNLLIATGWNYVSSSDTPANGWTKLSDTPVGGNWEQWVQYKYATPTDGALQQVLGGTPMWGLSFWEISGVSGTIADDILAVSYNGKSSSGSYTSLTTNFTAPQSRTNLALLGFMGQSANPGPFAWDGPSGYYSVRLFASPDTDIERGDYDWAGAAYGVVSPGIPPTPTPAVTLSKATQFWSYISVELPGAPVTPTPPPTSLSWVSCAISPGFNWGTTSFYTSLAGSNDGEGQTVAKARVPAGRFSDLAVNAHSISGTLTVTANINNADGNQTLSITTAGQFTDTVNHDDVNNGDMFCSHITAAGFVEFSSVGYLFDTSQNSGSGKATNWWGQGANSSGNNAGGYQGGYIEVRSRSATISNIQVFETNGFQTFTSYINESNGNQSVISAAASWADDNTNTDAVIFGDILEYNVSSSSTERTYGTLLRYTSDDGGFEKNGSMAAAGNVNVTSFGSSSQGGNGFLEPDMQERLPIDCVMYDMTLQIYASGGPGTMRTRQNGSNGKQIISWGTSTAYYRDTLNHDDFSAGDLFCFGLFPGSASNTGGTQIHVGPPGT